jgi:hypothetical protein
LTISHIQVMAALCGAWPLAARAQQAEQTRRIGVLMPFDPQDSFGRDIVSALREGLKERGWAEGRNIRIDERWIGRAKNYHAPSRAQQSLIINAAGEKSGHLKIRTSKSAPRSRTNSGFRTRTSSRLPHAIDV